MGNVIKRSTTASSGTRYGWKAETFQHADFWNMEGVEVEFEEGTSEEQIAAEMQEHYRKLQELVEGRAVAWRQEQEA